MSLSVETKCIHLEDNDGPCTDRSGALSFPIYQTASFAHKAVGEGTGYDYSRLQNPTREQVEKIVCGLENGIDALAFSSGMAAISALMELFHPGDHLIIDEDLYGGSIRLFQHICEKNGLTFTAIDFVGQDVTAYIKENTKGLFIETPTNPMMNVIDIEALAKITKQHKLIFIVDNTFLSPYFQNPLDLGADVVIHSGTKYLGGHNDTIAGFLVTNNEKIGEELRYIIKTTGAGLAPMDAWLILRGIKTLAVRMERIEGNAKKIANWLTTQDRVEKVYYPGLPKHPGYEIMKRQARGFGGMITFEVKTAQLARDILREASLIQFAESLGGTESLITYPITQTHMDVPPKQLERNGITDKILRLSVGIEGVDDLIAELDRIINQ